VAGFNPHSRGPNANGRAAEFGWIVAPRIQGTGANTLPLEERSLGALIAVPSWWRTVLIRICATGLTEEELSRIDDTAFWSARRDQCRVEALRLPGTATELSRRLGIEVQSTPWCARHPMRRGQTSLRCAPADLRICYCRAADCGAAPS
jgi:hypothetical protein